LRHLWRLAEALEAIDKALRLNRKYVDAWANRANTLSALGQYEDALQSINEALTIRSKYALAWNNRASTLEKLGRHRDAIESYRKALELDPKYGTAWHNLGSVLSDLGQHQEALESFDNALTINSKFVLAWNNRGHALSEMGKWKEAVDSYDKAITTNPGLAIAWANRGANLCHLKRYQEAVDSYNKALAIDNNLVPALVGRGVAFFELCIYVEAVNSFDEALKLNAGLSDAWDAKNRALERVEKWLNGHRPPSLLTELYDQVARAEARLHNFIQLRLKKELGDDEAGWWVKGIPLEMRQECMKNREAAPERLPPYSYVYLIDLKKILDKSWKHFESDFQRVKGQFKSKNEFLASLGRLNDVRNAVMHPIKGTANEDDLKFARDMRQAIEAFAGPG